MGGRVFRRAANRMQLCAVPNEAAKGPTVHRGCAPAPGKAWCFAPPDRSATKQGRCTRSARRGSSNRCCSSRSCCILETAREKCVLRQNFWPQDLENTVGSWDMYGQDDKARYNSLQVGKRSFWDAALVCLGGRTGNAWVVRLDFWLADE